MSFVLLDSRCKFYVRTSPFPTRLLLTEGITVYKPKIFMHTRIRTALQSPYIIILRAGEKYRILLWKIGGNIDLASGYALPAYPMLTIIIDHEEKEQGKIYDAPCARPCGLLVWLQTFRETWNHVNHDGVRRYGEMGQDGGDVSLGMLGMLGLGKLLNRGNAKVFHLEVLT